MSNGDDSGRALAARVPLRDAALADLGARGISVPEYERSALQGRIVHIGVGGFHRAHLAMYTHELAGQGGDWGIRGVGLLPPDEAMGAALSAQDGLYTLIERDDDRADVTVVGSIIDYTLAARDTDAAVAVLADPVVAIVSLTITEAGYAPRGEPLRRADPCDRAFVSAAEPAEQAKRDLDAARGGTQPLKPIVPSPDSAFGVIAAALDRRRSSGAPPLTILSCDNLPGNGDAARAATLTAAHVTDAGLADWIDRTCTFPNSMVDRITPTTTDADREWLAAAHGIVDRWPVVTEPFRQWVVEDRFANGRPRWEAVGVLLTDDVDAWELYKLRLLNAAHSSMAYLCALAGIVYVDEAIAQSEVRGFLDHLLADEAIPTLRRIDGHPPEEYVATVLHRFANTGVRDQIARLCLDGASKFPTFLVPTIEHQLANGGPVARSALALAGWARYLGTVPASEQAADAAAGPARALAAEALADPERFLALDGVLTTPLRTSPRFRAAFVDAYRSIADVGPVAAMLKV